MYGILFEIHPAIEGCLLAEHLPLSVCLIVRRRLNNNRDALFENDRGKKWITGNSSFKE